MPGNKQQTEQTEEESEQMELGNMKIGQRLFAGFGIVLLLMAALGIVSYLEIGTMYMVVVTGLAIVIGIGVATFVTRSIAGHVGEMARVVEDQTARGDVRMAITREYGTDNRTTQEVTQ